MKDKKANGEPLGIQVGWNRKGRSREGADSSVQSRRPSVWLEASRPAAEVSCQLWAFSNRLYMGWNMYLTAILW